MTPEEINNTLIALGDTIRANPVSFSGLPTEAQGLILQLLTPMPNGWSELQSAWVPRWWLKCGPGEVDMANGLLSAHGALRISDKQGYLPASLLADADGVYSPIGAWLRSLVLHYTDDITWEVET